MSERENVYLADAEKIAHHINRRDASLTSHFSVWLKHGEYFVIQSDAAIEDGIHIYTGEGWDATEKVDAEWVLNNMEIPESS